MNNKTIIFNKYLYNIKNAIAVSAVPIYGAM